MYEVCSIPDSSIMRAARLLQYRKTVKVSLLKTSVNWRYTTDSARLLKSPSEFDPSCLFQCTELV